MDDVAQDPVLNVSERGDRALHRQVRGQGPDAPVGRQRGRPLPGRRAALQGLPEQGARVGARSHGVGVPELHAGLQHDRRDARQRRRAAAAARRTPTSTSTSCATTAGSNYRWMNRPDRARACRRCVGAAVARGADWDVALAPPRRGARGQARVRARVAESVQRGAVPARRGSSKSTGGRGAFRVRARAPRRRCRASRISRCAPTARRTWRGAELHRLHAQRHAARRASRAGDVLVVADHELTRRRRSRRREGVGAWSSSARRCRPGARDAPTSCCRSRTSSEEEGTFTNLRGRVQRFLQAKAAPGLARPSWFVLADLLARVRRAARTICTAGADVRGARGERSRRSPDSATTRSACAACRSPARSRREQRVIRSLARRSCTASSTRRQPPFWPSASSPRS